MAAAMSARSEVVRELFATLAKADAAELAGERAASVLLPKLRQAGQVWYACVCM